MSEFRKAGAAWVELFDDEGHIVDLPEREDRTIESQINEALRIANVTPMGRLYGCRADEEPNVKVSGARNER